MSSKRAIRFFASVAVVPIVALAAAGCGGSGGGDNASAAPPKTTDGQPATVGATSTSLGTILVDSKGDTLYQFGKDSGTKSACFGACATAWPPLRATGKPTAGTGVNSAMLGTMPRSDGAAQVTYNGHPLYLFEGDKSPGDTNGEGSTAFGGSWLALSASGSPVTGQSSSSNGSSTGSGGYAY
jgi:predicted lipoprotein with Yx(FWY)xxD motif